MTNFLYRSILSIVFLTAAFVGQAQLKEKNPAEAEYTKKLTINSIRDYLPGKHIKQRINFGGEYLFYSRLYFPKIDWRKVDCTAEVELGSEKIKEFKIKSEGKKDVEAFKKLVFELCGSYENPRKTANGNFTSGIGTTVLVNFAANLALIRSTTKLNF